MDFPPVRDWPGFPHQHYPPRAALQWWEQLPVRQTADGMKLELDTAKLQYGTPFFEILYPEKR